MTKKLYLDDAVDDYRKQHGSLIHLSERHGEEDGPRQTEDHNQEDAESTGDVPQKTMYVAKH